MKKDKQDQNAFSRRDFIKTTATGAGAAALTGLGVEARSRKGDPRAGIRKRT